MPDGKAFCSQQRIKFPFSFTHTLSLLSNMWIDSPMNTPQAELIDTQLGMRIAMVGVKYEHNHQINKLC